MREIATFKDLRFENSSHYRKSFYFSLNENENDIYNKSVFYVHIFKSEVKWYYQIEISTDYLGLNSTSVMIYTDKFSDLVNNLAELNNEISKFIN